MLEEYIIETVKKELVKQKLNVVYGKNNQDLEQENEKLKNILNEIHEICASTWGMQLPYFEVRSLLNKIRKISENSLNDENDDIKSMKQENKKLKKELLDSKNGLNCANHVIKNNKEWINKQDKKIKELEEEIRLFKSDKEDLQYNLRRVSIQKIQLKSKNKSLEENLTKISNLLTSYNTSKEAGGLTFFSLMCLINDIENILKES